MESTSERDPHLEAVLARESGNIASDLRIVHSGKVRPDDQWKVEVERRLEGENAIPIWTIRIALLDKVGQVLRGPKTYERTGDPHLNYTNVPFNVFDATPDLMLG